MSKFRSFSTSFSKSPNLYIRNLLQVDIILEVGRDKTKKYGGLANWRRNFLMFNQNLNKKEMKQMTETYSCLEGEGKDYIYI